MTERWKKEVEKIERPDDYGAPVVSSSEVVKLLARQHRAVVSKVRRCQCDPEDGPAVRNGYNLAKADILSALREMGKK